jgi:hypothetical protein
VPVIFLSFVQRTTSHGGCGVSASDPSWLWSNMLLTEVWRECVLRKAGEVFRGDASGDGDSLAENRLSKGCKAPGRCL